MSHTRRAGAAGPSLIEKIGLLRELDLFEGLSEEEVESIAEVATLGRRAPGDRIMSPDDPRERIHIVKRGSVRLYRLTADGRRLTLGIYEKGTILGDMQMLGQERVPGAYAEAIDEVTICTVTPDELCEFIERYPRVGINIIRHLARRLENAESDLEAMAYQTVGQRFARKLTELASRFGTETADGTLIQARITQQELAEMIGTTRETLAHTLSDFKRRGLVETMERRFVIRDPPRLSAIASDLGDDAALPHALPRESVDRRPSPAPPRRRARP